MTFGDKHYIKPTRSIYDSRTKHLRFLHEAYLRNFPRLSNAYFISCFSQRYSPTKPTGSLALTNPQPPE